MTASQDTLSHDWWWLVTFLPRANSPLTRMLWLVGIKSGLGSRFSLYTIKQQFSTPLSDDILHHSQSFEVHQNRLEKETILENISSDQIPVKALSIVNTLNKKEKK